MRKITLGDALEALGPRFQHEVRSRLAPVRARFFPTTEFALRANADYLKGGLRTSPLYLTDPELRKVAIELAVLALDNGIDVNIACDGDGDTFLHYCVLLRESSIAIETVTWLLRHGADPERARDDGETPLSLAIKKERTEIVELLRGRLH
jgi:ankyrin repeat protein